MKAQMKACEEKRDIEGLRNLMNDCKYRAQAARDIGWPALADSWQADADHIERVIQKLESKQ